MGVVYLLLQRILAMYGTYRKIVHINWQCDSFIAAFSTFENFMSSGHRVTEMLTSQNFFGRIEYFLAWELFLVLIILVKFFE